MISNQDIRWQQRFSNYNKALKKFNEAIEYIKREIKTNQEDINEVLDEIIKEGLIQRFEYTYELAWNVMKDYAYFQGDSSLVIGGSRDALRFAFDAGLIENGELWMEMIKSHQQTTHTYDEETANEIYLKIINEYQNAFLQFQKKMESLRTGEQQRLDFVE
jgi:nucleotidyltransferase substrate binding protein (TIGR01987 family)